MDVGLAGAGETVGVGEVVGRGVLCPVVGDGSRGAVGTRTSVSVVTVESRALAGTVGADAAGTDGVGASGAVGDGAFGAVVAAGAVGDGALGAVGR